MLIKFFKFGLILLFYQSPLYSKSKTLNDYNSHHLSNYFSGIVAFENKDNSEALKFFKASKFLIKQHNSYLEKYIYSLVLEGKIQHATNEIKQNLTKGNSNFFEANLLMALDSLKKKDFKKSKNYLELSSKFVNNDRLALVVYESLKQYLYVFEKKQIPIKKKEFGDLSLINEVFQRCYLEDNNTEEYFKRLTDKRNNTDFSRYIFFYINYLIKNNNLGEAKEIANKLDNLDSTLLILQGKKWIEELKFEKFKKFFSCTNSNDILSEFLFLIANLYSSQEEYKKSNFYLNISQYLNPSFKFNLSLLATNYYLDDNYKEAKKVLKKFNEKDDLYYWFKIKKETLIISKELSDEDSLNFINEKFKKIKYPSIKMTFDIANFNKNSKKYQNAITYYNEVVLKIDPKSNNYAEILYRRGMCYEQLGEHIKSDKDLLKSLLIKPDDAYILNYLAYSWLERKHKINDAMHMLEKAYNTRRNDPYIIDSIGWAYYLHNDFIKAEKFLRRAVELMPEDPIVNDHYGDILWQLNRKIQARYFWKNVLNLEKTENEMKKIIDIKLIEGLKKS